MIRQTFAIAGALALLAGCSQESEPEEAQAGGPDEQSIATDAPRYDSEAGYQPKDATVGPPVPTSEGIPGDLQGRWGMVANDCDPARDDAKGLLEIDGSTLTFYESVGTLAQIEEREESRLRGTFDFSGEGMTWQREIVLDAQEDGQVLIRREFGDDAASGPFRYEKCS